MAYTNQISAATSYKYIVTGTLPGPFHTIQACINYVLAQGETATILIRPGLYVENLTLYDGINLQGSDEGGIIIAGAHTPPAAGTFVISNCTLVSNTDVFSSAAAGTCTITIDNCTFELLNGVVFGLANWVGSLSINQCSESDGSISNNIISNTNGAELDITDSAVGVGIVPMVVSGATAIFNSTILAPINNTLQGVMVIDGGSVINGAITNINNAFLYIYNSRISSGAASAITHTSTNLVALANIVIDSSAVSALDGTGTISIGEVVYKDSAGVAVTLVYNNATELHCSNLLANSSVEVALGDVTITNGQLVLGISGGTSGQIPIAATGANPAWATLTSPTGTVTFTPGVNTLGIDATGGVNWIEATVATNMVATDGYITKIAVPGILNYTLPLAAAQGTVIEITGFTVGLFAILQNANQSINFGALSSTIGVGGSVTATSRYDSIRLVCVTANLTWNVLSSQGNFTIV